MTNTLCLSFRFIQPYPLYHGRTDGDAPEWPPSPLRAFQALLNAACLRVRGTPLPPEVRSALHVLEVLRPHVVAPAATLSVTGHRAYVPHNHFDLVTAKWHDGKPEASIAEHRTEKDHRPHRLHTVGDDLPTVHYLYDLASTTADPQSVLESIRPSVRSITHLGWGIDQVIGDARLLSSEQAAQLIGERFLPTPTGGQPLRSPIKGTLEALSNRYGRFLGRLVNGSWTPVPPLTTFDSINYRRSTDPLPRPHATFRMVDENDDSVAYPNAKLIHIAGMVRHLAIEFMKSRPPSDLRGIPQDLWIERYIAGHRDQADTSGVPHTQLSYIPLQSIGMHHTDPAIRRVMIVAPIGDEGWLEHLARLLDHQFLKPDPKSPNTDLPPGSRLERVSDPRKDGVRDCYRGPSTVWATTTPVILPGHDDKNPAKTRKLIEKAIAQSGIDQTCEFEWSAFSHFPKMLSAHKYTKDPSAANGKRPINYLRPDHLQNQTAVHLKLTFPQAVLGPLVIGAGRHCGFGLMAAVE